MVRDCRNDVYVQALVVDEDTLRFGGSAFKRERVGHLVEDDEGRVVCSECGARYLIASSVSWCQFCGARVERDS